MEFDIFPTAAALLILGLGASAVLTQDLVPAVFRFLAYGLMLILAWVLLHGVDVALIEGAIGGGFTSLLLLRAASQLRAGPANAEPVRPEPVRASVKVVAALGAAGVALAIAMSVLMLPDPPASLARDVAPHLTSVGVGNPITAVLMAFRAVDTLLEAMVVLLALVGVWSLTPDRVWGGRPGPRYNADPHGILAFIARVLPPIGVIIGIYIFWVGADHPGGKFQGATIVAAMWLVALLAGLVDAPPIGRRLLRLCLVLGPAVFIAIGVLGAFIDGAFFAYPEAWSKPLILVIEFALMPSLALTLALVMAGPAERPADPERT